MQFSTSGSTLLALVLLLPVTLLQDATADPDVSTLTAAQVLERMTKTYAGCKSYRDTTDVHLELDDSAVNLSHFNIGQDKHAEIAFVRPDRFRFESTDALCHCIVWRQGANIRSWSSLDAKVEFKHSLKDPLDAFAGVSGGTAKMIPGLLLPDEVGSPLSHLVDAERRRDAAVEGTPCFQIFGKLESSLPGKVKTFLITLWIDQHTFLVRRLVLKASPEKATFTMTIDGKIDIDVSDNDLAFNPDKPK